MAESYSSTQKMTLAGVFVAGILALAGGGSPFWIVSDPAVGNSFIDSAINYVAKGYFGLFMFCVESKALNENECRAFDFNNDSGWFHTCRVVASAFILLSCINGVCALCLACCKCCQRFIALGISVFVAAALGAFAAGSFAKNTESFTSQIGNFKVSSYGWGFYIFIAAVIVMGVMSIMACISAPNSPMRGIIFSHAPAAVIVQTSSSMTNTPYMHLQDQGINAGPAYAASNGYMAHTGYKASTEY